MHGLTLVMHRHRNNFVHRDPSKSLLKMNNVDSILLISTRDCHQQRGTVLLRAGKNQIFSPKCVFLMFCVLHINVLNRFAVVDAVIILLYAIP